MINLTEQARAKLAIILFFATFLIACNPSSGFAQSNEFDVNSLPNKNSFKKTENYDLKILKKKFSQLAGRHENQMGETEIAQLYQNGSLIYTCASKAPHPLDVLEFAQFQLLKDDPAPQVIIQISSPRHSSLCILNLSPQFRVLYEGNFQRDEILFDDTNHDGTYEFWTDANDGVVYSYDVKKQRYRQN